jgi:hypothetical protein
LWQPLCVRDAEVTPTWIQIPNYMLRQTDGNKVEAVDSAMSVDFVKKKLFGQCGRE